LTDGYDQISLSSMSLGKYSADVFQGAISVTDKYGNGLTNPLEVDAARKELTRESDELPDIGPEHFDSLEQYAEWVMDGAQRFMAS
jgi:hypothetical protein